MDFLDNVDIFVVETSSVSVFVDKILVDGIIAVDNRIEYKFFVSNCDEETIDNDKVDKVDNVDDIDEIIFVVGNDCDEDVFDVFNCIEYILDGLLYSVDIFFDFKYLVVYEFDTTKAVGVV